jgi:hypothetical protein
MVAAAALTHALPATLLAREFGAPTCDGIYELSADDCKDSMGTS